jgi:2-C-methyl-D-erythritol 2,4-cyclodiphosphate synthase
MRHGGKEPLRKNGLRPSKIKFNTIARLLEKRFHKTMDVCMGLGTDRHRLAEGLPLWLGGVLIESSSRGCVAHSDGDVVLHALVDALLGSVAMGDIGDQFPPSDPQWKNTASTVFVEQTLERIRESHRNYQVKQVDITIHLEAPKLGPYKQSIRASVATLLGLSLEQVNVKAKTGEGLPPVGTLEAIEAMVLLSALKKPLHER